jgi:hypothetical protein
MNKRLYQCSSPSDMENKIAEKESQGFVRCTKAQADLRVIYQVSSSGRNVKRYFKTLSNTQEHEN